jgi:hypothetical protein
MEPFLRDTIMNFSYWYNEIADMPTKADDGTWFDLETGIPFIAKSEPKMIKLAAVKHPDQALKMPALLAKINRLIESQKINLDRSTNADYKQEATRFINTTESLIANKKSKKADLLAAITENSDLSRMFNSLQKGS